MLELPSPRGRAVRSPRRRPRRRARPRFAHLIGCGRQRVRSAVASAPNGQPASDRQLGKPHLDRRSGKAVQRTWTEKAAVSPYETAQVRGRSLQLSGIEFGFDQTLSRRSHQPSSCCAKATRHGMPTRSLVFGPLTRFGSCSMMSAFNQPTVGPSITPFY
jgi:hypothetical protein